MSLDGAPEGGDPGVGDIGYWAPDGDLAFYYGDLGFWNGIVRIGEFDGSMDLIERQSDDFSATIERTGVGEDDAPLPSLLTLSDVFPTGHHCAVTAGVGPRTSVTVIGDGAVGLSAAWHPPAPTPRWPTARR